MNFNILLKDEIKIGDAPEKSRVTFTFSFKADSENQVVFTVKLQLHFLS